MKALLESSLPNHQKRRRSGTDEQEARVLMALLALPTKTILGEIADPRMARTDVAMTYAMCLSMAAGRPDWPRINGAILGRWSPSGLEWIKRRAWRLVEERKS